MIEDVLAGELQAETIDQTPPPILWNRGHDDRGCPTRGDRIRGRPNQ